MIQVQVSPALARAIADTPDGPSYATRLVANLKSQCPECHEPSEDGLLHVGCCDHLAPDEGAGSHIFHCWDCGADLASSIPDEDGHSVLEVI